MTSEFDAFASALVGARMPYEQKVIKKFPEIFWWTAGQIPYGILACNPGRMNFEQLYFWMEVYPRSSHMMHTCLLGLPSATAYTVHKNPVYFIKTGGIVMTIPKRIKF